MKPPRLASAVVLALAALVASGGHLLDVLHGQAPAANTVDAAFQKFWDARSPAEAARLVDGVLKSGVTYDEALRRLKQGRPYAPQKPGVVMTTNRTEDKVEHYYAVNVPASYDPARRYQVRFQLHGGVMGRSTNQPRNDGNIGALAGAEQFYVIPYGWSEAPWWGEDQVLNLNAIVDTLKRTYNIDENRVAVSGVSDGGTGAYYLAMRDTTPFASFLPLNGFIMVLANVDNGIREPLYPNNLRNKPMYVVNGGRDRLYPTSIVEPYVLHMKKAGVAIDYHPQPQGEHNTAWWPDLKDSYRSPDVGNLRRRARPRALARHRQARAAAGRSQEPAGRERLQPDRRAGHADVRASRAVGPRGPAENGQHRRGRHARCRVVHPAHLAGCVRSFTADQSDRKREDRVRRHGTAEHGNAHEVGGTRQRPHNALRGGDWDCALQIEVRG
jgi:hypothetical protein